MAVAVQKNSGGKEMAFASARVLDWLRLSPGSRSIEWALC